MRRFPESEYHVPFFDECGYVRKLCPVCGEYFWTQNPDQKTCGEATAEGCAPLTFINNPPTRKRYSLQEMREAFLSFFERRGHERVKPYPVVARWRDDLYLTSASIVDFQPYVTNGITPPPANPLVISQPCIRLVDVDNVGPTFGRHLTIFEMGGHHAFNYPDKEVYWKDQTVRYHHEFVTEELGVKSGEVIYKEDVWSGGGNAGPDLETVICGLEVATLVFMKFKVVDDEFVELPIRTVDTGYGIDSRYTWLSQGSVSCFHSLYGPILDKIIKMASISRVDSHLLARVAELSGLMSLEKATDRREAREKVAKHVGMTVDELNNALLPIENVFAVIDHTKCLAFMLAEGVVPSNMGEGYLTRLVLRRTLRLLRTLEIQERLPEIISMQVDFWAQDFPYLKKMRGEILDILAVEQDKFDNTISRGRSLVKRMGQELKAKGVHTIPTESLIELYDSHGLPPEVVQETAEKEGLQARMLENFYSMVAERHEQPPPPKEMKKTDVLESKVSDLPETRMLYYEDPYMREFEAEVLRVLDGKNVVFDKTAFYPEGGGQPADEGYLKFGEQRSEVVDVQKVGKVILHTVKGRVPKKGDTVKGSIDWERRSSLMKHHTATHLIMGAARRVLGEHVWQSGSQKGVDKARLDVSHYQRLTSDDIHEIERLANNAVIQNIPVEAGWMSRGEAERLYGFRLYQGGVVPGKEIRVVKIGEWDVEACGGTHLKNTGEIGFIKIVHTERIQDGVERIVFSAGLPALEAVQERERLLYKVSQTLNAPLEKLEKTAERLVADSKEARRETKQLLKEIADLTTEEYRIAASYRAFEEQLRAMREVISSYREYQDTLKAMTEAVEWYRDFQEQLRTITEAVDLYKQYQDTLNSVVKAVEWYRDFQEQVRAMMEAVEVYKQFQRRIMSLAEAVEGLREINGLKVVTRVMEGVHVERLIKTANELIKREPKMVVVFCRVNETANIVVMAGKEAVKRGINAQEIADKTASVLGGRGSGRPEFAQGGGTLVEKASEALETAEKVVRKQLGENCAPALL